jgi:hypothetical protein
MTNYLRNRFHKMGTKENLDAYYKKNEREIRKLPPYLYMQLREARKTAEQFLKVRA